MDYRRIRTVSKLKIYLFKKNISPVKFFTNSFKTGYVFNGDFVDRGKKSLEVLLILLSCFLVFPGCVMLNRGNHEDAVMNHRYGFTREVHQKYRKNADRLLKLIDQVYRHLPLGTLINNKIFVVHGGISESTDLNLIASVRRSKVRNNPLARLKFTMKCSPFPVRLDIATANATVWRCQL